MNVHAVEVDHRSEKRLIAGFHALYSLGSVVGALAMATLLNVGIGLLYAAGVWLLFCIIIWGFSVNPLLPDAGKAQGVSQSFVWPRGFVLWLGLICFLLFMVEGAVLDWGGVFLVEEKSAAIENAGFAFAAFSTAMTLMRLIGDKLIAYAGPRNCVRYGCLIGALMLTGCVLLPHVWLVVVLFFALGLGLANVIPIAFASTADQNKMPMSLALAAVTTLGYAGLLTDPALIGFIAKVTSLSTALLMLAAFLVIVSFSSNIFRVIFFDKSRFLGMAMKLTKGKCLLVLAAALVGLTGCGEEDVGDVSLGIFTFKDIKINRFTDPVVTGVTCHVASIEANLSLSDPSNNSIECHRTGPITRQMIEAIDKSKSGEVIFKRSKSVLLKNMKIRRIYDAESQTLLYVAYSTKETSGSFHHSLSAIPLFGTEGYIKPLPKVQ